jgi:hypothetical protein
MRNREDVWQQMEDTQRLTKTIKKPAQAKSCTQGNYEDESNEKLKNFVHSLYIADKFGTALSASNIVPAAFNAVLQRFTNAWIPLEKIHGKF